MPKTIQRPQDLSPIVRFGIGQSYDRFETEFGVLSLIVGTAGKYRYHASIDYFPEYRASLPVIIESAALMIKGCPHSTRCASLGGSFASVQLISLSAAIRICNLWATDTPGKFVHGKDIPFQGITLDRFSMKEHFAMQAARIAAETPIDQIEALRPSLKKLIEAIKTPWGQIERRCWAESMGASPLPW